MTQRLGGAVRAVVRGMHAIEPMAELAMTELLPSDAPVPFATRLVVRVEGRALIVKVDDIDWIEADGNYAILHVGKEVYRMRTSLRALIQHLDRIRFVRIHKSTIANIDRIREVQAWFGGDHIAIMHDGQQLRVSRTHSHELLRPIR
jgi:two-component system, LytTR family, response regulator